MPWLLLALTAHADIPPPPDPSDVAARVARRCGPIEDVSELAFTFIVEKEGAELARRSHRWQPQTSQLAVTLGEETISMTVEAAMPTEADDPRWASLAPGVPAEQALQAWGAFVNDGYWLLAPCKVQDPGAQLQTNVSGRRLTVQYEGVGLTPGDVYKLTLDHNGMVKDWSFTLVSGRTGQFAWSADEAVGPLRLSLRRESEDGAMVVRFEGVSAKE